MDHRVLGSLQNKNNCSRFSKNKGKFVIDERASLNEDQCYETNGDKQLELAVKRTKMSMIRTGLAITTFGIVLWNLWTNKKQEKQISDIMGLV